MLKCDVIIIFAQRNPSNEKKIGPNNATPIVYSDYCPYSFVICQLWFFKVRSGSLPLRKKKPPEVITLVAYFSKIYCINQYKSEVI